MKAEGMVHEGWMVSPANMVKKRYGAVLYALGRRVPRDNVVLWSELPRAASRCVE